MMLHTWVTRNALRHGVAVTLVLLAIGFARPSHAKTVVCPGPVTLHGLDVSYWQLDIDWDKVKATGQKYVIMRAAHALKADTKFAYNWKRCHEVGLHCGVYQYFEPDIDPVAQADLMISMMGPLKPGDLPPVIDVESKGGATPAQLSAAVGKWIDRMKSKTGRQPMIYTGAYFWEDYVKSTAFVNNPLWHAQYCTNCCPNIANPWKKWAFWQYSSTGKVNGINGNVDTNRFNGDAKALATLAGVASCTPGCSGTIWTKADCTKVDCGKSAGICSTAVSGGPACVAEVCAANASTPPTVGAICLADGSRATCDSKGQVSANPCPANTACKGAAGKATCEPVTCAVGCKGSALVAKDCSQTDCAKLAGAAAGTCVADGLGPRCVSKHCKATGTAAVCVPEVGPLAMGLCQDGKVTLSNCLAGSQVCAMAGGAVAACAAKACAPTAGAAISEHADCLDAYTVRHCDAYGQESVESCPTGTICAGGPGNAACSVLDGVDGGASDGGAADGSGADATAGGAADAAPGVDGASTADGAWSDGGTGDSAPADGSGTDVGTADGAGSGGDNATGVGGDTSGASSSDGSSDGSTRAVRDAGDAAPGGVASGLAPASPSSGCSAQARPSGQTPWLLLLVIAGLTLLLSRLGPTRMRGGVAREKIVVSLVLAATVAAAVPSSADATPAARGPAASLAASLTPTRLPAALTPAAAVTPTTTSPTPSEPVDGVDESAQALDAALITSRLQEAAAAQTVLEAEAEVARAQAAQADALRRAEQAASEAARAVAGEQARIEAQKAALAGAQGKLAERQRAQAAAIGALVQRESDLQRRGRDPALTQKQADALFQDVVAALEGGRDAFAKALAALRGEDALLPEPLAQPQLLSGPLAAAAETERRAIALGHDDLAARRASLAAEERKLRRGSAADLASHLERLTDLRTDVVARMSPDVRDELFGLTGAGVRQLLRELRHLRLMAEWYPTSRLRLLEVPESFDALLVRIGTVLGSAFRLLMVLLLWLLLRRRWRPLLEALAAWLAPRARRSFASRVAWWASKLVLILGRELLLVLSVYLAFRIVLQSSLATELDLVYELLLDWAIYRLLLAAAHRFLTAAAADASRREISPELSARILASLRFAARFGLAIAIILALASHLLGRGYLYLLVVRFAWIFAVPVVLLVIRDWQQDICAAYLRAYPAGALAAAVERHRNRAFGVLVALAAFSAVAVTGVAAWVGELALRFEQTRRGLAYVFRRRLERQSLGLSEPVEDLAQLPLALREALTDRPVAPDAWIGEPTGMPKIEDAIAAWSAGGGAFGLKLVGGWGLGKTSWLDALDARLQAQQAPPMVVRATVPRGLQSPDAVVRWLAELTGFDTTTPEAHDAATLGDALGAGARQLVMLDDAGRVVTKTMGGMAAYDALATVIARSMPRVGWVLAVSDHASSRIQKLRGDRDLMTHSVSLQPWDETKVGELVADRMQRAGFTPHFDELVDPDLDIADALVEGVRVGERFVRLLWDQSDGNPRDVLHFWARSLAPYGAEDVKVRLFRAPSADALESLGAQARFALHAVLVHDGLTAEEAGRVLFESTANVRGVLGWLQGRGILMQDEATGPGRYRVEPHWVRAVSRYLQRKHLLVR